VGGGGMILTNLFLTTSDSFHINSSFYYPVVIEKIFKNIFPLKTYVKMIFSILALFDPQEQQFEQI
jgi:hypothetical protein